MYVRPQTLASRIWPALGEARWAGAGALMVGGALALTISAKIQIPFYPVPMTLQTLAVLAIGAAYGAPLAAATVALYLAEGLAGLPVFAGAAAGPAYFVGPTGGFLIGFLVAATLIGALAARGWDRSLARLTAAMAIGHIAIFTVGFAWLAAAVGPEKAWRLGVAPFYAATLLKTGLAVALVDILNRVAGRTRGSDA